MILHDIHTLVDGEYFAAMVQDLPVGVFKAGEDSKCVYVNSMWEKIAEMPAKDIYGASWEKNIHPDDLDAVHNEALLAKAEHRAFELTFRIITPNSNTKYVCVKSAAIRQTDDSVKGFVGTMEDVTDTVNNKQDVKDLRNILRALDDIIIEINASYVVTNCWIGAESHIEITEKLIGRSLDDFDLIPQLHEGKRIVDEVLQTAEPMVFEFASYQSGTERWFSAKISYVQGSFEEGNPRVLCLLRNISKQKHASNALHESREKFSSAFNYAAIGMAMTNPEGKFVKVNRSFCKLTGYTEDELLMLDFQSITHTEDLDKDMEFMQQLIRNERDSYELEKRYFHKDGHTVWILLNVSVIRNKKHQLVYFISQVQDITARKVNEAELIIAKEKAEHASLIKSEFLSLMSHEIRTPLNAIIGLTQILKSDNPAPHQQENLRILDFSSQNLLVLINDILDYNKIEAGKIDLEDIDFNLKQLLSNVKEANKIKADEKGIALKLMLDEDIPNLLIGDPNRLAQIINNLLSNAIKFTEVGGVTLSAIVLNQASNKVSVKFSVSDTGIGIPKDKQDIIFDTFTQAHTSTTRKFGGTGLGLAIIKKLVNLLGSDIYVQSEDGKGSSFYFTLGFHVSSSRVIVNQSVVKPDAFDLTGMNVLVVEDNNINSYIATKLLASWGIGYDVAENGLLGVEMAAKNKYDLILMDLQMPVMNGYEATNNIRSFNPDVPIIALSAGSMPDIREKLDGSGIDNCISKPFNIQELKDILMFYYRQNHNGMLPRKTD